jgi:hypothetical protein
MRKFGVGVRYGPVSRCNGDTALQRSRYQRPAPAISKDGSTHLQGWLLVPADAPAWAKNTTELWTRAAAVEQRRDAREAIFFDFSWPRPLPLSAADEVVHAVFDRFVAKGLAVQIDLETKAASDGSLNDHLHGLVSVRAIDAAGFVHQKARWLTDLLHSEGGGWARRVVADAFTEAAARARIKVKFDPRSNAARGLPAPEDRLPRSYIRNPAGQAAQHMLTRQAAQRRNAVEFHAVADQYEAVGRELDELSAAFDGVVQKLLVITPVTVDGALSPVDLETARHLQEGLQSSAEPPATIDGIGIVIPVGEGAVVDDGSMLKCEPPISTDTALVVSRLCRHRGWSRVEIESPKDQPLVQFDWYRMHQDIDLEHRIPDAARRAAERLAELLEVPQSDRALLLSRLVEAAELDGSADMQELLERIDICALGDVAPPGVGEIVSMASSTSTLDGAGLWRRWCKENELAMADLPGTRLGEVLRPGRRIPSVSRSEMEYDSAAR